LAVRIAGPRKEIENRLREAGVDLTAAEALRMRSLIGRDPTLTELFIFDIMWSEHCSYKSSKHVLARYLPTEGSRVILGPGEDAGVVRLGHHQGISYVLVVAHESHNHPSQILPVEGAATGIGGIVRDVYCMGADVVGVMDALRFGDPSGARSESVREICEGVIRGIWEYSNALGVPNVGGDVFFDSGYDENCLVNVIALGVAREEDIIRSRVPGEARAEPYEFILVGKPTDMSGLGGATLASRILGEMDEASMSAVQLHDPFLKRILAEASKSVIAFLRQSGAEIGFKDLGAGGIACAISEMAERGGVGARIDLDRVHVASGSLESYAIACSETQERYCLAVPARLSHEVLRIYNDDYELPHIYSGARASVVGEVTEREDLIMTRRGEVVVSLPVETVNRGITYDREAAPRPKRAGVKPCPEGEDIKQLGLSVLSTLSNCSKHYVYRHYDSEVKGISVLKPGEADACVVCIPGTGIGIATSVDGNPRYSRIDPYLGAAYAVCESMRNVACVGAVPVAITDCLNFGDPEDAHIFWDFVEAVRGIGDAAKALCAYGTDEPVPVVSGNVSFYNQSSHGRAIPPSPIVAVYGVLEDYAVAPDLCLKSPGNDLILIGRLKPGLGGSALAAVMGWDGTDSLSALDFDEERRAIHAATHSILAGHVLSCHDISEGGLFTTVAEMVIGGWGMGRIGAEVSLDRLGGMRPLEVLFSECGGFVAEVARSSSQKVMDICERYAVEAVAIGKTVRENRLVLSRTGKNICVIDGEDMRSHWLSSLERSIR
jgi:phosphoribosylformylglycinamidine synthase II